FGSNQRVERTGGCVRVPAIGVFVIVEHLHFGTGLIGRGRILGNAVHDAAVRARADFPLQFQLEVFKFLLCNNVGAFGARNGLDRAFFRFPRMVRKRIHFVSAPFVHRLAVEQNFPFPRLRLRIGAAKGNRKGGYRSKNESRNQSALKAHDLMCFESCIGCRAGWSSARTSGSLSETPSTKSQAPKKFQISNAKPKNRYRGKPRAGRFLSLGLAASFELGVWNLELLAW